MTEYFPKFVVGGVKVELDLSNYATKADLKNATAVNTSDCAKTIDLASLKSDVDKLHMDKLKIVSSSLSNLKSKLDTIPVNLSKLSNVVKNDVVKKTGYDELVKKCIQLN